MKAQLAAFFLLVVQQLAVEGKFSDELNTKIQNEQIRLDPHQMIIRKDITGGSSTYPLLERSTDFVKGEISLQNQRFPQNEGFVAHSIRLAYGRGATGARPGSISYNSSFPAILKNGLLVARQEGRLILQEEISKYVASGTAQSPNELFVEFVSPRYFKDVETIEWDIVFPDGQTLSASSTTGQENHFFEILMDGLVTRPK